MTTREIVSVDIDAEKIEQFLELYGELAAAEDEVESSASGERLGVSILTAQGAALAERLAEAGYEPQRTPVPGPALPDDAPPALGRLAKGLARFGVLLRQVSYFTDANGQPERQRDDEEIADQSCERVEAGRTGRARGTSWQFTPLGSSLTPETVEAAIADGIRNAIREAAEVVEQTPALTCPLPCTPVYAIDIKAPRVDPETGTGEGLGMTVTGDSEGAFGLELSEGSLWTTVYAYVVWSVYLACIDPDAPPGNGDTGEGDSDGFSTGSTTVIVNGKPMTVQCPTYTDSGREKGFAVGFARRGEESETRQRVFEQARAQAIDSAQKAAAAAIVTLQSCPTRCPTEQLSVTIGPFTSLTNPFNLEYTTEYRQEYWARWRVDRLCSP